MVPTRKLPLCPLHRSRISPFFSLSLNFSLSLFLFSSVSLFLSLSLSFAFQSKLQLFTLRRCALRANRRSSSREKWTRGCLMAPRRRRYRFIRADADVNAVFYEPYVAEPRCDQAECSRREERRLFPQFEGSFVRFFPHSPIFSLFKKETECSFSARVEITLSFLRETTWNFLLRRPFRFSLWPDFGNLRRKWRKRLLLDCYFLSSYIFYLLLMDSLVYECASSLIKGRQIKKNKSLRNFFNN